MVYCCTAHLVQESLILQRSELCWQRRIILPAILRAAEARLTNLATPIDDPSSFMQAVATEADSTFFSVSSSDLVSFHSSDYTGAMHPNSIALACQMITSLLTCKGSNVDNVMEQLNASKKGLYEQLGPHRL